MIRTPRPVYGRINNRFLERLELHRAEEERHYVDGREVCCYVMHLDFRPDVPLFAGSVDPFWVYLSANIPGIYRSPVVVHENVEHLAWSESYFNPDAWEDAHILAIGRELEDAKERGMLEEYWTWRRDVEARFDLPEVYSATIKQRLGTLLRQFELQPDLADF